MTPAPAVEEPAAVKVRDLRAAAVAQLLRRRVFRSTAGRNMPTLFS